MEKLELIYSLRKKNGNYHNPKLSSFKICQTETQVFVEFQTNTKAQVIIRTIYYCDLFEYGDFGSDAYNKVSINKEITENVTILLGMTKFQLLPYFPEIFKPRMRKKIRNAYLKLPLHEVLNILIM